ncbi:FabG Dehydrogenase with different specificities related to short-chain alcohol dehydrogenase [Pyrenophora tritici-repentis]|nr:FabG Dehydrogenase with different specificities related to short-chain alcohol dehydrogenase [Pyrenophora tritici-repentis]
MPDILRFLHSQFFVTPPKPTTDLTGKTVIVTGSNVGLGKEAARHFTALNASTVILAVRSLEKGEAARADIEATTGRKGAVKVMQLDMSSYASVLDFAARAAKDLDRIDIAVLNAGIIRGAGIWEVFEQDESTITVNVVSTFLLAFALLPKMKETAAKFNTRPTLTVVSSEVHGWSPFNERKAPEGGIFARLNEKVVDGKDVSLAVRYQTSKLLEVLFVREFCEKYPSGDIPVTVNLVNPGYCKSEFQREQSFAAKIGALLLARTTEVGSRTLVHAGVQGEESHGRYFSDSQITEPSPYVRSEEGKRDQGRVWRELVGKLEGIMVGVTKV